MKKIAYGGAWAVSPQVDDFCVGIFLLIELEGGGCELLVTLYLSAADGHLLASTGGHGYGGRVVGLAVNVQYDLLVLCVALALEDDLMVA